MSRISRVCKRGGWLLLEVNVYFDEQDLARRSEEHARMHPHSFFPDDVIRLVRKYRFEVVKIVKREQVSTDGEHFFLCTARKR